MKITKFSIVQDYFEDIIYLWILILQIINNYQTKHPSQINFATQVDD